tara:strand:- start:253 stop:435 length:183 start_codon:yes stop_codon:yes gene_type:complete
MDSLDFFEVIGRIILMLMILGSAVLIVWVNVRENPYLEKNEVENEKKRQTSKALRDTTSR